MQRLISLIIFIVCLVLMYINGTFSPQTEEALKAVFWMTLFGFFSLALIWFGDELGAFTGVVRGGHIGTETPGCLVRLAGWFFLAWFIVAVFSEYIKTAPK